MPFVPKLTCQRYRNQRAVRAKFALNGLRKLFGKYLIVNLLSFFISKALDHDYIIHEPHVYVKRVEHARKNVTACPLDWLLFLPRLIHSLDHAQDEFNVFGFDFFGGFEEVAVGGVFEKELG